MCQECVDNGTMTKEDLVKMEEFDELLIQVIKKARELNVGPEYVIPRMVDLAGGTARVIDATNMVEEELQQIIEELGSNEEGKVH